MFGNNPKRGVVSGDGSTLFVQSMFQTLQGEGPNVGLPSVFLRLGGCNLACSFCDTEFESYQEKNIQNILEEINILAKNKLGQKVVQLVVITGGEPLRQPISPLCIRLLKEGYQVQIETNGTLMREIPGEVEIICSPKVINGKYHKLRPDILSRINALKFIVSENVPGYDAVPDIGQSNVRDIEIFVQPMDQYDEELNKRNMQYALKIALDNGYRLSLQTHKIIGIE